jgi:chromosomal replication initiation ATPase DnaA
MKKDKEFFKVDEFHAYYWIVDFISRFYATPIHLLVSERRFRSYVVPRQIMMYFIKEYNNEVSLKSIGQFLGGRDHSTVIHGLTTVNDLLDTDAKFTETVNSIRKGLDAIYLKDKPTPENISEELESNIETLQLMSL